MPRDSGDTSDDGRSLWWMIPAAVAAVLGFAGATILQTRKQHAEQAHASTPMQDSPSAARTPLADLPADTPLPE